jgi:hypothetical protein
MMASVDTRIANSTTGLEKEPPSPPDFGSIGAKAQSWNWITASKVGIHDYGMARRKGVDGGPSPAMTGWAWSVPRSMQLLLGVA